MSAWLTAYLIAGPGVWGLMWIGYCLGQSRMNRLITWDKPLPLAPPKVTVVIPAKDEGPDIALCIRSVLAQDYPDFEVIAVDDRSRDDTGAILDQLASNDSRMRVVHIPPAGLPVGWLGKCNALYTATRAVESPWLLFVDSDVTLESNALRQVLSIAHERKYDAVSILTRLECRNRLEALMLPLLAGAWAIMHAISLTNQDSRKDRAAANGQFFLIRREAYEAVGGHSAVKDRITEDVELARTLKANDFKIRFYLGSHLAATRMHSTFNQMLHGWSRIYSGSARRRPWKLLIAIGVIICSVDSVYPAIVLGSVNAFAAQHFGLLAAAVTHWLALTLFLRLFYVRSGNSGWSALAAPYSTSLMLTIFIYSLRKCQTGRIVWRDSQFDSRVSVNSGPTRHDS